MSLQSKFAILLAMIGVAVVASVGAAIWSFDRLARDVSRPIASISLVMDRLEQIKGDVEFINATVGGRSRLSPRTGDESAEPPPSADAVAAAGERLNRTLDLLASLEGGAAQAGPSDVDWFTAHVGRTTLRSVREKVGSATSAVGVAGAFRAWQADRTPDRAGAVLAATAAAHDLIEKTEGHLLAIADHAVSFDRSYRTDLLLVLGLSFLWAALVSVQGFLLLRRWVMRPVADLRTAAARIGGGDFDHRVPVRDPVRRDELSQLSVEVNHMAAMVRSMQDERIERERLAAVGEMVRRLAHNLRNPLAGIRALAEVTRADLPAPSDLRDNQDRIIAAVDRFERWLKELLGATSPLSVQPSPSPVRPMLQGLIQSHQPAAQSKDLHLSLDVERAPETALFDARHLEQALVALVANAIDASPPGGSVVVSARSGPGAIWEVTVADQGPGVPPELAERIFRPYFTTKKDGNGIGLAVAHQVVSSHGGSITVERADLPGPCPPNGGPGALFRVRLPLICVVQPSSGNPQVANNGHNGAAGGENSRHRR